jgi:hypothetical protein
MKIKSQNHTDETIDPKLILYKLVSYIYDLGGHIANTPNEKQNNLTKKEIAYVLSKWHQVEYYEN